jgi:putative ABC transport system ATP-binding protein
MTAFQATRAASPRQARAESIIEIENVVKTYDSGNQQVTALRGVSLSVARGEMVAIMGPSGCGKTTLLNCASGLDVVDAGTIRIAGENLAELSDKTRTTFRARNMGFVFQTYNLLPVLTAVENVELPLIVSGVRPKVARQQALAALERVGLREWANQRPGQLSGGQRQRVTIARSVVNRPAIVWADEPTGALDSATATDIMDLLVELNQTANQTCVIVTHDPKVAARCHRTIQMADGRIIREDSQEEMAAVAAGAA